MPLFLKKNADLLAKTPREALGDSLVDTFRAAIREHFSVQEDEIYEITGSPSQIRDKLEEAASKIPDQALPKTLYAIVHTVRPDNAFVAAVWRHRVFLDDSGPMVTRNSSTEVENSIFYFMYQVDRENPEILPRIHVKYVVVGKKLRRQGIFKQAIVSLVHLVSRGLAGAVIDFKGDNLIAIMTAEKVLEGARFLEITDYETHPLKKPISADLVDLLAKAEVFTETEREELRRKIGSLPGHEDPQWKFQVMEVYNLFVRCVRKNYEQHPHEAGNEVRFMFERLKKHDRAQFIQEDPYRGDIWVETWLPNKQ